MIRAVVVDDEPPACRRITDLLEEVDDIRTVAACSDPFEALATILDTTPDLLFLDVHMPELSGFELLERLEMDPLPAVVFVTAFDEYAVRAFEVHALDYITKPFSDERFAETLRRAREAVALRSVVGSRVRDLLRTRRADIGYDDRVVIPTTGGRRIVVPVHEIDWIDAAGVYVRVYRNGERLILRESLSSLEQRLDPEFLARIHRSTMVNLGRVAELQSGPKGELEVVLSDGTTRRVGRKYRDRLKAALGAT